MTDVHDYITKGITRSRLKLEARRAAHPTAAFALGFVCAIIGISYFVVHVSKTFGRSTETVRFVVSDDFGVFKGVDEVRLHGVAVGTIATVKHDGAQLVLTAKIQKRYTPIYRNAQAEMRSVTPLNDVYLNIVDVGTPAAGKASSGHPVGPGQTKPLVTVPDVLDSLRHDQRAGLHILLDQLGNGLANHGQDLRRLFVNAIPFVASAANITRGLDEHRALTKRLVHNTAVLTGELGRRETALRRLVATGAITAGTLGRSSRDLDLTLRALPPTFSELRLALQSVRGVTADLDHGLTSLEPVVANLPSSLTAARRLGDSLAPAAKALSPAVTALVPLSKALQPTAGNLHVTATQLRKLVPTTNRLTQRLVDCMTGIQDFFQWNTSLTKFGDSNAPVPRGQLAIGVPGIFPGAPARTPGKSCAPGPIVGGRPMQPGDGH
jgi:ABC-type transporter Mla subunit MlaD